MLSPERRKHLKRKKKKKNFVTVGRKSLRNLCNPDPVNQNLECLGSSSNLIAHPGLGSDRETNQTLFLYKELRRQRKSIQHNSALKGETLLFFYSDFKKIKAVFLYKTFHDASQNTRQIFKKLSSRRKSSKPKEKNKE